MGEVVRVTPMRWWEKYNQVQSFWMSNILSSREITWHPRNTWYPWGTWYPHDTPMTSPSSSSYSICIYMCTTRQTTSPQPGMFWLFFHCWPCSSAQFGTHGVPLKKYLSYNHFTIINIYITMLVLWWSWWSWYNDREVTIWWIPFHVGDISSTSLITNMLISPFNQHHIKITMIIILMIFSPDL